MPTNKVLSNAAAGPAVDRAHRLDTYKHDTGLPAAAPMALPANGKRCTTTFWRARCDDEASGARAPPCSRWRALRLKPELAATRRCHACGRRRRCAECRARGTGAFYTPPFVVRRKVRSCRQLAAQSDGWCVELAILPDTEHRAPDIRMDRVAQPLLYARE
eukprot:6193123-Pleurochrysis_carterae.AAC.1